MGAIKIEAIVIENTDYDDFAKLVKVFSKQYGLLSFFAPGVNKEASKNKYSVQNFSLSEFEIFKARREDKVSKLKTGRLINEHYEIAQNFNNYTYSSVICNVLTQVLPPGQKAVKIYQALKLVLTNFKNKRNGFINYVLFLLYLIQNSTYKLVLNRCGRCYKFNKRFVRFEFASKMMVCFSCIWPGERKQPQSFINLLANFERHSFAFLTEANFQTSDLLVLHIFLINYLVNDLGIFIGALKLLKNSPNMRVSDKILLDYQ